MKAEILIFKTNINTLDQMKKVDTVLSQQTGIEKWNVDLEDCDKVLRIETFSLQATNVIGFLKSQDIYCEALE